MNEIERYFKGLADGNRLRILNLLLHGELCGCDIQHVLDASQPNISRHLQYLKNAGLVLDRRDGFRIFYRLSEPTRRQKKHLFDFLRHVFKDQEPFGDDTRKLKEAIQHGACTRTEWQPYSALGKMGAAAST
jgi:ArsR family transcriptional regulator, arsenate/arsenite/antimonite-responsive transcriptional repressor